MIISNLELESWGNQPNNIPRANMYKNASPKPFNVESNLFAIEPRVWIIPSSLKFNCKAL